MITLENNENNFRSFLICQSQYGGTRNKVESLFNSFFLEVEHLMPNIDILYFDNELFTGEVEDQCFFGFAYVFVTREIINLQKLEMSIKAKLKHDSVKGTL